MNQHLKDIQDFLQQNSQLSAQDKGALLKALADADKQLNLVEFKLDRTEKVKRTTAILLEETIEELEQKRKAVEAQNRELEIESSLERVRTVAMGMQRPEDMPEICRIISQQLESLGISEIRNVQTAIFHGEKGTYTNFEYYRLHDKMLVTEVDYTSDQISTDFAAEMMTGTGQIFIRSLKGQDLQEWFNFQKTTNVFIDIHLEKATSLNYHWFSLGPVALGISTYAPLNETEIDLFKRFRNVFELSYRRYLDIEKAVAQAHEAKIEASLERVRAVAMSLRKSEDLIAVCEVMYKELSVLGFTNIRNAQIAIKHDEKKAYVICEYSDYAVNILQEAPYNSSPIVQELYNELGKTGDALYQKEFSGKEFEDWRTWRKGIKDSIDIRIDEAVSMCFYLFSMGTGHVGISTFNAISNDQVEVLKRFKNVFELSYRRYTDVAKAEAQAREAKIEAALEKVRSRSLAMHKSDELREVVASVFGKLQELDFSIDGAAFICTYIENSKDVNFWIADHHEQSYPTCIRLAYYESPSIRDIWMARESGIDFFSKTYSFEEKNHWFHYAFDHTDIKMLTDELKNWILQQPCLTQTFALAKNSMIGIHFHHQKLLSKKEIEILKRFAIVFDQAYIRFLDLQKAEGQAREAKIEAALERARTQSMVMQHSKELDDTLRVFHEQVLLLGIQSAFSFLWLPDEDRDRHIFWAAWAENNSKVFKSKSINYPLDRNEPATAQCLVDWKGSEAIVSYYVPPSGVENYFSAWQELIAGVEELKAEHFRDGLYYVEAFMKYGCFGVIVASDLTEHEKKVLGRFAIEFERTYTRFLDLRKAEAQAREAQIEGSLERVRSKTMAMHSSQDVGVTVAAMFDEFVKLGIETFRCGIGIVHQEKKMEVWTAKADDTGKVNFFTGYMDMTIHPMLQGGYSSWKKKQESYVYELKGDDLKEYFNGVNNNPNYPLKYDIPSLPPRLIFSVFYFPEGFLFAFTREEIPVEATKIFKRFSGVFGQTYRRYLDLQKAEAQTREAKIEAALERVRARAMAMQNSDELGELVAILFDELIKLDLVLARCIIWIFDNDTLASRVWMANSEDKKTVDSHFIKRLDHPYYETIIKEWKERNPRWVYVLEGSFKKSLDELLLNETELSRLPEAVKKGILDSEHTIISGSFNNFGLIEASGPVPHSEEQLEILNRFGKVFDLTYTRFNDLKQAEAQAREAIKASSLDRVRAEIASMRTTADLEKITPLIWNELTTLGVPFTRCGVFIMDEEQQKVQTLLSTPDGKAIATLHVPFGFKLSIISNGVSHWRKREIYKEHWDAPTFTKAWIALSSLRDVSMEAPQAEHPPENLYLHMLPFLQGMLYVGNDAPLNEDDLQLVQNLANAFSTAYARYEDFNKLEAAKQQVDKTLIDLKQAQTQLIQSEKMASLGELTAGIAHEIQNPLNFVNNFSEVSNELLDEMRIELEKGDTDEAKAIAEDVKQNLEKILHHGKRADAIVKGMLQHSRTSTGQKEMTGINALADEYLRLAYHGLRAKEKSFNAKFETHLDPSVGRISIVPQDIGRVLLNLINNAFYAVTEKSRRNLDGYDPTVTIATERHDGSVIVSVKDNGNGIPSKVLDKIFQPFFTTKPTGLGTGLGLSLSYDIITKGHGGELKVETKEGEGSEFIISLPA